MDSPCKITHGIPWNSVEFDRKFSMEFCLILDMEFHGILENISMEFYGVPQKLNSMEFCLVSGL